MKNKVVYRHLKPCGEVFYIGYGSKARAHYKYEEMLEIKKQQLFNEINN